MSTLGTAINNWRDRSETALSALVLDVSEAAGQKQLAEAMRYSLLAGGKRLRPVLVYAGCAAIGNAACNERDLDRVAAAVECIHTYSLIHDDLPAMDDDDIRRGRPTCHRAFDEATAVLAGDALQTLAFELIATADSITPALRIALVNTLARASGLHGMAGGQAIDMISVGKRIDQSALEDMHRLKTGALIRASLELGARLALADDSALAALTLYGESIGLAFQVQDDILDHSGSTEALGKMAGADAARDKPTYVSLLGESAARALAEQLVEQAIGALDGLPGNVEPLVELAHYIITRDR